MKTSEDLKQILERIDHRGYPAYKDTRGAYQFGTYILGIDHVQEIRLRHRPGCIYRWQEERPGFREIYMTANVKDGCGRLSAAEFCKATERYSFQAHGSGKSGSSR